MKRLWYAAVMAALLGLTSARAQQVSLPVPCGQPMITISYLIDNRAAQHPQAPAPVTGGAASVAGPISQGGPTMHGVVAPGSACGQGCGSAPCPGGCPAGSCTTGTCATGGCASGHCTPSGCAAGGCAAGGCSTGGCATGGCPGGACGTGGCGEGDGAAGGCATCGGRRHLLGNHRDCWHRLWIWASYCPTHHEACKCYGCCGYHPYPPLYTYFFCPGGCHEGAPPTYPPHCDRKGCGCGGAFVAGAPPSVVEHPPTVPVQMPATDVTPATPLPAAH
jgi:hypothetical protein